MRYGVRPVRTIGDKNMEPTEIIKLLLDAPLTLLLLYLLLQEQRAHAETRRARDEDNHRWVERFALVSERVAGAIEALEDRNNLTRLRQP